jgi:hypothetical protein
MACRGTALLFLQAKYSIALFEINICHSGLQVSSKLRLLAVILGTKYQYMLDKKKLFVPE